MDGNGFHLFSYVSTCIKGFIPQGPFQAVCECFADNSNP